MKSVLSKLKSANGNNKSTAMHHNRNEIETLLTQHNQKNFAKAKETNTHNDKLINLLCKDKIIDKHELSYSKRMMLMIRMQTYFTSC